MSALLYSNQDKARMLRLACLVYGIRNMDAIVEEVHIYIMFYSIYVGVKSRQRSLFAKSQTGHETKGLLSPGKQI